MSFFIIALVVIVLLGLLAVSTYNSLISLKQKVKEAASDIDVQLKRRYDLIPNLIETVKGSAKFESETMTNVIKARQTAMGIQGLGPERLAAEGALSQSVNSLLAVAENYPDLKSSTNFLQLQNELTNTEDRILSSRRFYNQVVSDYNALQDQFPAILFKGLAGAVHEPFFELENPTEERKAPVVKF